MAANWTSRLRLAIVTWMAVFVGVLLIVQTTTWAQTNGAQANGAQTGAEIISPTARVPIVLDGRELFSVGDLAGFMATERAAFAHNVLQEQVRRTPTHVPIRVRQLERNSLITLRVAGRHLLTLTDEDLIGGIAAEEQAEDWVNTLQEALDQAQYERTDVYRQQMLRQILFGGLVVGGLSLLLQWGRRYLRRRRTLISDWQLFWAETGFLLVQWGVWLGFAFWLTGRFPQSRSVRYGVVRFLEGTFTSTVVTLGGQELSVLKLAKILALAFVLWLVVRALTGVVRSRVLQGVGAGREVQDAIALLMQIVLVTLGLLVLLQAIGVDVSSLAILVSVIGVGVGFGLQNIANNFISGIIILLERPIQVGDFVKLGDLTGTVEHIGIRSTEICTLDRVTIIVPNSEFIDSKVINWSHGYPVSRLQLPLGVAYGSAIAQVRQAVLEAAKHHPQVLRYPKPQLWFDGFGESSLDFNLMVWIREPRRQFRIRSDLYYLLEANLRRYQIEIPFPQRDLNVRAGEVAALVNQVSSDRDQHPTAVAVPTVAAPTQESPSDLSDLTDMMEWFDILELTDEPTAAEIKELVVQMRGPEGIDIRDRRFGLRLYQQCFVGSDAVQWFMQQQLASREEAIRLGQLLLERGMIHHVTDEHPFKDAHLFYRFFVDEALVGVDDKKP